MPRKYEKTELILCDNITRYRLLSSPDHLTNREIRVLENGCSSFVATRLMNQIKMHFAKKGLLLESESPRMEIPVGWYLEFKKWNFERIQELAFAEMQALNQSQARAGGNR